MPTGPRSTSDRLSAIDAAFLHAERNGSHAHIGGIARFSGITPSVEELRRHVESRLHLVPRYRQRLHHPWPGAWPIWIDADLDLAYHVQAISVTRGSGEEGIRGFAERIFSQRLDRYKPLWEMWLVDGFDDDTFALINKTHHALIDGASGVGVAGAILDLEPEVRPAEAPRWSPRPAPPRLEVAIDEARALATRLAPRRRLTAAWDLRGSIGRIRAGAAGAAELVTLALTADAREPICRATDAERRVRWLTFELADLDQVRDGLGGTINDAFVGVGVGALGTWLRRMGVDTFGFRPRALIPVSTRSHDER